MRTIGVKFLSLIGAFFGLANLLGEEPYLFLERKDSQAVDVLTNQEEALVEHVKTSIQNGKDHLSKISEGILGIKGMSSPKIRHFLNNLCSLPKARYLEIGCWKGSTLVAAVYGNEKFLDEAIAMDNWSEFDGPKKTFDRNCKKYIPKANLHFYSLDCFSANKPAVFRKPINIYFYDGHHSEDAHELAFTYYDEVFEDSFIAIVDDWCWDMVRKGTFQAFEKLGYKICFEEYLPSVGGSDTKNWWNGLYVAVVRKVSN